VLAAAFLIPALILAGFAINVGYILLAKEEIQKAADAAALAGASQIFVAHLAGSPLNDAQARSDVAKAVIEAKRFCLANTVRGANPTLLDADCVVGYVAIPTNPASPLIPWTPGQPYPNAVQVTVRRDQTANSPVSLLMSRILGTETWSGSASATASASRSYTVTGFNGSPPNHLLPFAIDVLLWNAFLASGRSPDGLVHDAYAVASPSSATGPPNNVTSGADNLPEFTDMYPNQNSPGNFGLVSIGPPATDLPTFQNWIDNGSSPSDMAFFGPDGLQATPASPLAMAGGPGVKNPVNYSLQAVIGEPRSVVLFSACTDSGSNMTYTAVGFAGVTVVQADGHGQKMQITIQPSNVIDPTATNGSGSESWNGGTQFIYKTSPLALIR